MNRRAWTLGLYVLLAGVAVATLAGLATLYPWGGAPTGTGLDTGPVGEQLHGTITAVRVTDVQDDFLLPGAISVSVDVALDDGRDITVDTSDETGLFDVGRRVVAATVNAEGMPTVWAIVDFPRGLPLIGLTVAFALAVVALGRWQGIRALVGMGASALLIVGFFIPALLDGASPTLLALVTASAVMLITLPLSHGLSSTVAAAAVGTVIALVLTVGLALLAVEVTSLTGLTSEDVQLVRFSLGRPVDLQGLLLAGMIVGTLGVLDDVTVSQASTVAALRRADPTMPARRVLGEALAVGRDHIAATVNTLFLAYAGASLPLLILFSLGGGAITETLTSELVAQEIVRTLVGSIGLVVAVPVTTSLAALALDGRGGGGHSHGVAVVEATSAGDMPVMAADSAHPAGAAAPAGPAEPAPAEAETTEDPAELDPEASLRRLFRLDDDQGERT